MIDDRYELIEPIGTGGTATVWRGTDTLLGRSVAIKRLLPQLAADPIASARFRREAQAAAGLSHPGIVTVFDTGADEDGPYIVLELIEGRTLSEALAADGPFSPSDVVAIIEKVGSALDYAHEQGIVHRDIKPSNIILEDDGTVRLTDFGIARTESDPTTVTAPGDVVGTIAYMSPEALAGEPVVKASDIYSLGAVTYQMLSGQPPFHGDNLGALIESIRTDDPPPLTGVPEGMAIAVARALATEADRRPDTAGELAAALAAGTTLVMAAPAAITPAAKPASSASPDDATRVIAAAAAPARTSSRVGGGRSGDQRFRNWALVAGVVGLLALVGAVISDPEGSKDVALAESSTTTMAAPVTTATTATPSTTTTTPPPEITVESLAADIRAMIDSLHPSEFKKKETNQVAEKLDDIMKEWSEGDPEDDKLAERFENAFEELGDLPESDQRSTLAEMFMALAGLMDVEIGDD